MMIYYLVLELIPVGKQSAFLQGGILILSHQHVETILHILI